MSYYAIGSSIVLMLLAVGVLFLFIPDKKKEETKPKRKLKQMKVKVVSETGQHHVLIKKPNLYHDEFGTWVSNPSPEDFLNDNSNFVKINETTFIPRERIISIDFEMEDYDESAQ